MRITLVMSLALGLYVLPAAALEPPPFLPIQGELTDDTGAPLSGEVRLKIALYSNATGGTPVFQETQVLQVEKGSFTASIGAVTPLDFSVFQGGTVRYVGLTVGDDPEMTPRLSLGTAPYAAYVKSAGDASTLQGRAPASFASAEHTHAWSSLTGVPASFPPSAHGHPWSEITGVPASFPPSAHSHAWSEITGKPAFTSYVGVSPVQIQGQNIQLEASGVTSSYLANGAVTSAKLAAESVGMRELKLPMELGDVPEKTLTAGTNTLLNIRSFIPPVDGACFVTVNAFIYESVSGTTPFGYVVLQPLKEEDGTLVALGQGNFLDAGGYMTANATAVLPVTAGKVTRLGCNLPNVPPAVVASGTVKGTCWVSYLCT